VGGGGGGSGVASGSSFASSHSYKPSQNSEFGQNEKRGYVLASDFKHGWINNHLATASIQTKHGPAEIRHIEDKEMLAAECNMILTIKPDLAQSDEFWEAIRRAAVIANDSTVNRDNYDSQKANQEGT
jgi:hypothetical protein